MIDSDLSLQVDLWSAWYAAFSTWDSTINFWLTATFAVLVAAHALSSSMSKQLAHILVGLYGAFCIYTLLRGWSLYLQGMTLSSTMMSHGIEFSWAGAVMNLLADIIILLIVVLGSVISIRFVLASSPK